MGRKIDMKKIEDITKCQVTFSKRRTSLIKKVGELSTMCGVDVAFVAFSPSGRVSKFSNKDRIEDVLEQYVNLPADKRLNHIDNIEEKIERLNKISHINGDNSKLNHLDNQIENLELQIKKYGLELQMLESGLRTYELDPEQDQTSLHQLSSIERNLNHSLQRVLAREDALQIEQNQIEALLNEPQNPLLSSFYENGQASSSVNPNTAGNTLMQLDPWISPYSAGVQDNIIHNFIDQHGKQIVSNPNQGPSYTSSDIQPNMSNFTLIQEYPNLFGADFITPDVQIPPPLIPSEALISDATHMSTQGLGNFQAPRFVPIPPTGNPINVEMSRSLYDWIGTNMQYSNSNLVNQLSNIEELNWGYNDNFIIENPTNMDSNSRFNNVNSTHMDFNSSFVNVNTTNVDSNRSFDNANPTNMDCNSSFGIVNLTNMNSSSSFINENPSNDNVQLEGDHSRINGDEMQKIEPQPDAYVVLPPEEGFQNPYVNNIFSEVAYGKKEADSSIIQKTNLWECGNLHLDENFNFQYDF